MPPPSMPRQNGPSNSDTMLRTLIARSRKPGATMMEYGLIAALVAQALVDRSVKRSFMLDLCLPPATAEDAQLNLNDVYPVWVLAHGPRRAKLIRRVQILRLIIGHHWSYVRGGLDRILKLWGGPTSG
jgi:hypothetical protein